MNKFRMVSAAGSGLAAAIASLALAAGAAAAAAGPVTKLLGATVGTVQQAAATVRSLTTTAAQTLSTVTSTVDTSSCTSQDFSQPFLSWKDQNWYTLAPGQADNDFTGEGWALAGGANISTATLPGGQSGHVLDLPSGAVAISPPMCVQANYPTARTMIKTTGIGTQLAAGVVYANNAPLSSGALSGNVSGKADSFTPSGNLQVHPGNRDGWQLVRFVFGSTGLLGDNKVYNFYVDPRMH
jgi:hypothetical protein